MMEKAVLWRLAALVQHQNLDSFHLNQMLREIVSDQDEVVHYEQLSHREIDANSGGELVLIHSWSVYYVNFGQ